MKLYRDDIRKFADEVILKVEFLLACYGFWWKRINWWRNPLEVKSGKNYTYSSLNKFKNKYQDYLSQPIIIHQDDLKQENDILYLSIYMTSLL